MKRILYCGGPAVGPARWLAPGGATVDLARSWPQLRDRTVIGTYRGRTAVALACDLLGIGAGHEVLVPAYNCGTELDPLLQAGATLVGYDNNRSGEIDLADVQRRRTACTRAVYLIHYFGWEQPMQQLRRWCDEQGLLLIEDCALALFSDGPAGTIGRVGDAAIYSLPKTLGFSHGGLLSLQASPSGINPPLAPAGFPTLLREIKNSTKVSAFAGLETLGLYGTLLKTRQARRGDAGPAAAGEARPDMPADYYFQTSVDANRTLHPRARAVAGRLDWQEIVRRRRANYTLLTGALFGCPGIRPLHAGLPPGVCPLSFPLLVAERDACVRDLQARGIAALPWWAGFHQTGIDWNRFPDACWLKQHVLTLPVHQGLDAEHMNYIAESVRSLPPALVGCEEAGESRVGITP